MYYYVLGKYHSVIAATTATTTTTNIKYYEVIANKLPFILIVLTIALSDWSNIFYLSPETLTIKTQGKKESKKKFFFKEINNIAITTTTTTKA